MSLNVFEVFAKIGLDTKEYEKGLNDSKSKLSGLGKSIKSGLATAAKVGLAATTAAIGVTTAAVAGLTKEAISSYKEYEQLEGGVKKLYGNMGLSVEEYAKINNKSVSEVQSEWEKLGRAQDEVLKNAQNAYKTAGMSANQYMETATSFSASLIKSLGGDTKKAAEMTDVAMKAIADNYNTFGGDIGMIQGAFQGFAKQNYTMLDNLKLGYGGTKTEMEKLIKDANEYAKANGKAADLSIDSFADIVQAIQLIQEKQQIAETTAREAMTTIEGSANATKAAWQDVLIAIGKGEGIGSAFDGLITALFGEEEGQGLLNLVIPRLQTVFDGISKFVDKAAPLLADKLPKFLDSVLPGVLNAGSTLIMNLSKGLVNALPFLVNTAADITLKLLNAVLSLAPELARAGISIIENLVLSIEKAAPQLLKLGNDILSMLISGITTNFSSFLNNTILLLSKAADYLISNLDPIIDVGLELLMALAQGFGDNLPLFISKFLELKSKLIETFTKPETLKKLIEAGKEIITALWDGIKESIPIIMENLQTAFEGFVEIVKGIDWEKLGTDIIEKVKEVFGSVNWEEIGSNIITLICNGIEFLADTIPTLLQNVAETAKEWFESVDWEQVGTDILDFICDALGKLSETVMGIIQEVDWEQLGSDIITFIGEGIDTLAEEIPKAVQAIAEKAKEWFEGVDWEGLATNVINFIKDGLANLIEEIPAKMKEIATKGKEWFESVDWVGIGNHVVDFIINGLVDYYTHLPDMLKKIGEEASEWIKGIDWEQVGKDLITVIITGIDIFYHKIPQKLFEIGKHAVEKIMETDWVEVGKNIIRSIIEGVVKIGSALGDAIVRVAKGGYEATKTYYEVNSPSRKMMWIGEMLDKGLAEGIADNADLVSKQIEKSYNFDDVISRQGLNVDTFNNSASTNSMGGGFVQNLTINAPQELDPSEIARQTRNANRELVLQMRLA